MLHRLKINIYQVSIKDPQRQDYRNKHRMLQIVSNENHMVAGVKLTCGSVVSVPERRRLAVVWIVEESLWFVDSITLLAAQYYHYQIIQSARPVRRYHRPNRSDRLQTCTQNVRRYAAASPRKRLSISQNMFRLCSS